MYFSRIKQFLKRALSAAGIDLTRNMYYDRLTARILKRLLHKHSNCIDVGSHQGEFIDRILRLAPGGMHFAFEPIPAYYTEVNRRYGDRIRVYPYALSDKSGTASFCYVRNAPSYSGLKKRKYAVEYPDIEEIDVEMRRLDQLIPPDLPVAFIKIDVEGAEYQVIRGGRELIKRSRPCIVFEFGLGGSNYYHATPRDMYELLVEECGLKLSLLPAFLNGEAALTLPGFESHYLKKNEYYFIAHPQNLPAGIGHGG